MICLFTYGLTIQVPCEMRANFFGMLSQGNNEVRVRTNYANSWRNKLSSLAENFCSFGHEVAEFTTVRFGRLQLTLLCWKIELFYWMNIHSVSSSLLHLAWGELLHDGSRRTLDWIFFLIFWTTKSMTYATMWLEVGWKKAYDEKRAEIIFFHGRRKFKIAINKLPPVYKISRHDMNKQNPHFKRCKEKGWPIFPFPFSKIHKLTCPQISCILAIYSLSWNAKETK